MHWLLNVGKALLALVVLLTGTGLLLPRERDVERSLMIQVPIQHLWQLVADPKGWTEWSPWYSSDPATTLSYSGSPLGAGATWSWDSPSRGKGDMRFTAAEPPTRLDYRLGLEDVGAQTTGTLRLEPHAIGVRVIWTLHLDLGWNPAMRWFGPWLERSIGNDFDHGLRRLSLAAERSR